MSGLRRPPALLLTLAAFLTGSAAGTARADALSWNRLDVHVGNHTLEVDFDLAQERVVEAVAGAHPSAERPLAWYEERRAALLEKLDAGLIFRGPRGDCVGAELGPLSWAPERHVHFTRRYDCGATTVGPWPLSLEVSLFRGPAYGFNVFGAVFFHDDRQLVAAFDGKHPRVALRAEDFALPAGKTHAERVQQLLSSERQQQREADSKAQAEWRGTLLVGALVLTFVVGVWWDRLRARRRPAAVPAAIVTSE